MNSKILSAIVIMGIFALIGSIMSPWSVDLQNTFAAKGGEPGCGENKKAFIASQGKCFVLKQNGGENE